MRCVLSAVVVAGSVGILAAQTPAGGPRFDVVSIKRNTSTGPGGLPLGAPPVERSNGALRLTAVPVVTLLLRAYPETTGNAMVGLPQWVSRDRFDVDATSSLAVATPEVRAAMMRALLEERFHLVARVEKRSQRVLALTLSRGDGRLGRGLTSIETDCPAVRAAERAAVEAGGGPPPTAQPSGPDGAPPPCRLFSVSDRGGMTRVRGEGTMADVANLLRFPMRETVVDRTGLAGSYRVAMEYQVPMIPPAPDASLATGPDVATALGELGLKIASVTEPRDVLIVERLEPPSEN